MKARLGGAAFPGCGAIVVLASAIFLAESGAGGLRLDAAEAVTLAKRERQGVLAGLPSQPGPALEKVKALGNNQWVDLGSPAADPKWGKALGRTYGPKMPYASDLGGAFLNGTGTHAALFPDGRYTDDIWFYDLYAHRWIAIYPGTNTKTFVDRIKSGELKMNDDGQLANKEGEPVPFAAIPHHSYQLHTYDPDQGKYVVVWGNWGGGGDQYTAKMPFSTEANALLAEQMKGKTDRVIATPFYFNTITGKFERFPVSGIRLPTEGTSILSYTTFYLPGKKALWLYAGYGKTLICDPSTRQWSDLKPSGSPPQGGDFSACYDSKRERVYVGVAPSNREPPFKSREKDLIYAYDVQRNSWSNLPDKGGIPGGFASQYTFFHYDSVSDRVICVSHLFRDDRTQNYANISVFDPETGAWDEKPLTIPAEVNSAEGWNGFYSPEVNAHFIFVAPDSNDRGTMWAYRYKREAEKK